MKLLTCGLLLIMCSSLLSQETNINTALQNSARATEQLAKKISASKILSKEQAEIPRIPSEQSTQSQPVKQPTLPSLDPLQELEKILKTTTFSSQEAAVLKEMQLIFSYRKNNKPLPFSSFERLFAALQNFKRSNASLEKIDHYTFLSSYLFLSYITYKIDQELLKEKVYSLADATFAQCAQALLTVVNHLNKPKVYTQIIEASKVLKSFYKVQYDTFTVLLSTAKVVVDDDPLKKVYKQDREKFALLLAVLTLVSEGRTWNGAFSSGQASPTLPARPGTSTQTPPPLPPRMPKASSTRQEKEAELKEEARTLKTANAELVSALAKIRQSVTSQDEEEEATEEPEKPSTPSESAQQEEQLKQRAAQRSIQTQNLLNLLLTNEKIEEARKQEELVTEELRPAEEWED